VPPRKKVDAPPSTMKEFKDTLWKAADKLRGSMDASQYKDVILGLVLPEVRLGCLRGASGTDPVMGA